MSHFPKSAMIKEVKVLDVGFLSFKLNGDWIAERIRKNLKDGIAAWAPILPIKRVIVDFPEKDIDAEDGPRPTFIRHTLVHMLEYSGVEVCDKMHDQWSLHTAKREFPEKDGAIINRRTLKPIFKIKEKASSQAQPNNVHEELAALLCGEYSQKANSILYVTPVRQREYISECFDAARSYGDEHHTSMSYLGYQTSNDENEKLDSLMSNVVIQDLASGLGDVCCHKALKFAMSIGHNHESIVQCIIRYEYLKKYTYSSCTFEDKEMFGTEENNFINLLETRYLIGRVLEESCPNLESNEAFFGREREMGLHILQFTEIIEEAVLKLVPHMLCNYLYTLSKNFHRCIQKTQPSETWVLLCKAAEVVMDKGFDILGITPASSKISRSKPETRKPVARDHYIALSCLRPRSSRFEIFSMYVEVFPTDFENGFLFGDINVSDMFGVRPDVWSDTDLSGCGKVAYFSHDWYDPIKIRTTFFKPIPFGNPASGFSVPFDTSIKIAARLWVTSKEKDRVYQLCSFKSEEGVIDLEDFWTGGEEIERSTFTIQGQNGLVSLYYFLIREAVDTSISLTYEPPHRCPKVRGYIYAYYGNDVLRGCPGYNLNAYKALIFETGPTTLTKGSLTLERNTLAVPKNGVLWFDAFFVDVDTGVTIVKTEKDFSVDLVRGCSTWNIGGGFNLVVNWLLV